MRTKRGIEVEVLGADGHSTGLWWHTYLPGQDGILGPQLTTTIRWQHTVVGPAGPVGMQPQDVLELVAERLRHLNAAVPSRETSIAITKVDEAILWLEERTRERMARGVEGTHEP